MSAVVEPDEERSIVVRITITINADADADTVGGAVFDKVGDLFHEDIIEIVDYSVVSA